MSKFYKLSTVGLEELWVEFGAGVKRKWIALHQLAHSLSPPKSGSFLIMAYINRMWYCFFFSWKRKEVSLGDLEMLSQSNRGFSSIIKPFDGVLSDNSISAIERFICLMYGKTTYISNVNNCWRMLFMKKSKTVSKIPPTRNALIQHVKRAEYQAG